jgi:sulfatase maturation enzyme AslB (radical SAM superfamily)
MAPQLIVSPYPDGHVIVSPGREGGVRVGSGLYAQLRDAPPDAVVPDWLVEPARVGLGADVAGRSLAESVLVRPETPFGYARASYELNLGCNFDCEHCYLGEKRFDGLRWPDRQRLLDVIAASGVLWLQLTGGEPLIDSLFAPTYEYAFDLGMLIQLSSNGSTLYKPEVLEVLTTRRPYRVTLSIYGGTADSYDAMTRRRGSFKRFMRGLAAAHEADLPLRINIVVSNRNSHEIPLMREIAARHGAEAFEYAQISPTFHGHRRGPGEPGHRGQADAHPVHRLQRGDHPLPRRPAWPRLDLQDRPPEPGRPRHRGHSRPGAAGRVR